jgi:hypothetical protein
MDIVEGLAQQAAETINGGEFYDGKWYTEGQRQAWRKAMTPAADEIERLREALRLIAAPSKVIAKNEDMAAMLQLLLTSHRQTALKALGEKE